MQRNEAWGICPFLLIQQSQFENQRSTLFTLFPTEQLQVLKPFSISDHKQNGTWFGALKNVPAK